MSNKKICFLWIRNHVASTPQKQPRKKVFSVHPFSFVRSKRILKTVKKQTETCLLGKVAKTKVFFTLDLLSTSYSVLREKGKKGNFCELKNEPNYLKFVSLQSSFWGFSVLWPPELQSPNKNNAKFNTSMRLGGLLANKVVFHTIRWGVFFFGYLLSKKCLN